MCVCVCVFCGFSLCGEGVANVADLLCLHFRMPLSRESKGLIKGLLTIGFP